MTDYVIVDIEANGLLDTVDSIHCIVLRDKFGVKSVFHDGRPLGTYHHMGDINDGINEMVNYAKRGFSLVGHNLCGYDFPMLKKLRKDYHYQDHAFNPLNNSNIIDTYMVVSMLFPEEMPGLDYWGRRLGKRKPVHEDWSKLSLEMIERCMADTSKPRGHAA